MHLFLSDLNTACNIVNFFRKINRQHNHPSIKSPGRMDPNMFAKLDKVICYRYIFDLAWLQESTRSPLPVSVYCSEQIQLPACVKTPHSLSDMHTTVRGRKVLRLFKQCYRPCTVFFLFFFIHVRNTYITSAYVCRSSGMSASHHLLLSQLCIMRTLTPTLMFI